MEDAQDSQIELVKKRFGNNIGSPVKTLLKQLFTVHNSSKQNNLF